MHHFDLCFWFLVTVGNQQQQQQSICKTTAKQCKASKTFSEQLLALSFLFAFNNGSIWPCRRLFHF